MLAAIVWLVTLGGFPAVPTHGFASAAVFPLLFCLVVPAIYPAFLKTGVRLHLEAQAMLAGNTTVVLDKNKPKGEMSDSFRRPDNENEEVIAVCAC